MTDHDEPTTSVASQEVKVIQIPLNLPMPPQLAMTGNLATNWKRFYRAWNNYEIAARLRDPINPSTKLIHGMHFYFKVNRSKNAGFSIEMTRQLLKIQNISDVTHIQPCVCVSKIAAYILLFYTKNNYKGNQ